MFRILYRSNASEEKTTYMWMQWTNAKKLVMRDYEMTIEIKSKTENVKTHKHCVLLHENILMKGRIIFKMATDLPISILILSFIYST